MGEQLEVLGSSGGCRGQWGELGAGGQRRLPPGSCRGPRHPHHHPGPGFLAGSAPSLGQAAPPRRQPPCLTPCCPSSHHTRRYSHFTSSLALDCKPRIAGTEKQQTNEMNPSVKILCAVWERATSKHWCWCFMDFCTSLYKIQPLGCRKEVENGEAEGQPPAEPWHTCRCWSPSWCGFWYPDPYGSPGSPLPAATTPCPSTGLIGKPWFKVVTLEILKLFWV